MKLLTCFLFGLILICSVKRAKAQSLDTSSVNTAVKIILYYDLSVQNIPSTQEIECYVRSKDKPFDLVYLKSFGFKDFMFVSATFSMKDQKLSESNNCSYKINKVNNDYLLAFDLKHRKAYKLRGFKGNDIKQLYLDYLYLNSDEFPSKRKKKFFKSKYTIEGFDLKKELQ